MNKIWEKIKETFFSSPFPGISIFFACLVGVPVVLVVQTLYQQAHTTSYRIEALECKTEKPYIRRTPESPKHYLPFPEHDYYYITVKDEYGTKTFKYEEKPIANFGYPPQVGERWRIYNDGTLAYKER